MDDKLTDRARVGRVRPRARARAMALARCEKKKMEGNALGFWAALGALSDSRSAGDWGPQRAPDAVGGDPAGGF